MDGVTKKRPAKTYVRWCIKRDMPEILDIERQSFGEFAWSEDDFIRCLRQRNCIGMVADCDDLIAGYMIYELHKARLHVLNFAVECDHRRMGIGTMMVNKLIAKLSLQRRSRIHLEVRESNLAALNFFKAQQFRAVSVLRDFYDGANDDAYLMQYRYGISEPPKHPHERPPLTLTNRIKKFLPPECA